MPLNSVRDAMHEKDRKGWSREQAIAIGLKGEREAKKRKGKRAMARKHGRKKKRY